MQSQADSAQQNVACEEKQPAQWFCATTSVLEDMYALLSNQFPYSRKLSREKLSRISRFCGYLWKFSPWNLRAWHPLAQQKRQSAKVFSAKIVFFTNSRKFSSSKVSRYTVCTTKTRTQQLVSRVFLYQRTVARLSLVWYKTILQGCVSHQLHFPYMEKYCEMAQLSWFLHLAQVTVNCNMTFYKQHKY